MLYIQIGWIIEKCEYSHCPQYKLSCQKCLINMQMSDSFDVPAGCLWKGEIKPG